MPILYVIMALETMNTSHQRSKVIISLVLLFSLLGDILLLNSSEKIYFTYGLVCFLVVHVLYTIFFFRIKRFSLKRPGVIVISLLIIAGYQFFLFSNIWQKIVEGDFIFQVIVYAVSIALMFVAAGNTTSGRRAQKVGWQNFVPGAALFIISDSLLALIKFYPFVSPPKDLLLLLDCGVMVTYGAAQMLLVSGAVKFIKK
jgi:uncharacterized membrane protein YhhN